MGKVNCPISGCDYSSDTGRGVSIHASQAHPEENVSFTNKKEYECTFCEAGFEDYPSRRESKDSTNHFCSRECKDSFEAKDGLDTECTECDKDIHIPPSHIDEVDGYEQKNYFCSKDCESSFKSREWVKEDHPSWDGGRDRVYCEECGDEFYVRPAKTDSAKYCSRMCTYEALSVEKHEYECVHCGDIVEKKPYNVKGENTTCSKECHKEFMRSIRKGKDNPCWNGGRFEYYGPNWNEQREKTLEQDNSTCQDCGMTMDEHIQNYDQELHVHHRVPRRQIIDEQEPTIEQFELANSMDNLITLCKSCHRERESK